MTTYEDVKEWRKKNKEKLNEQARRYRAKHPETNKKAKEKYREKNLETIRERDKTAKSKERKKDPEGYRRRYKVWRDKKEAKLWEQAGRPRADCCELCGKNELTVFDHCHSKGHFRGWICDTCNKVLGLVKDSTELLRKMASYLEKEHDEVNSKEKERIT